MTMASLRRIAWTASTAVLLAAGPAAFAQGSAPATVIGVDDLPVVRLVLGTAGVATFEHEGTVQGDVVLILDVPREAMDDLLQTLVVQDVSGGRIGAIDYAARDALTRRLQGFRFDLTGDPGLPQLLQQARGEQVALQGPDGLARGTLVTVEREEDTWFALTLTQSGLVRTTLQPQVTVRFEDAALQAELREALALLQEVRGEDRVQIRIALSGEGERTVRLSYLRAMPVFKTAWRLAMRDDGQADLLGYAILDNPTDLDLRGSELVLLAGRPIAFVTELLEPVHIDRPRVGPPVVRSRVPEADAGAFRESVGAGAAAEADMPFAPAPAAMRAAPDLADAGATAAADAVASDAGASFAYRLREPLDLPAHRSALVPIVQAAVPAERVTTVAPLLGDGSAYRTVTIVNDTGALLPAGSVTIYAEDGVAGSARMGDVPAGAERLLAYAHDGSLRVVVQDRREQESVVSVRAGGGLLTREVILRDTTVYRIVREDGDDRTVIVRHPARPGFEPVGWSGDLLRDDDAWRLRVAIGGEDDDAQLRCPPGPERDTTDTCTLQVVMERSESREVRLADLSAEQLVLLLRNVPLSDAQRAQLARIQELQQELADAEREVRRLETERDDWFREHERLRESLAVVPSDEPLYRNYLNRLAEAEDALDRLRRDVSAARDLRDGIRQALTEAVRTFGATSGRTPAPSLATVAANGTDAPATLLWGS